MCACVCDINKTFSSNSARSLTLSYCIRVIGIHKCIRPWMAHTKPDSKASTVPAEEIPKWKTKTPIKKAIIPGKVRTLWIGEQKTCLSIVDVFNGMHENWKKNCTCEHIHPCIYLVGCIEHVRSYGIWIEKNMFSTGNGKLARALFAEKLCEKLVLPRLMAFY